MLLIVYKIIFNPKPSVEIINCYKVAVVIGKYQYIQPRLIKKNNLKIMKICLV